MGTITRDQTEQQAIFARCERFLNGHGPLRPKEALAELAGHVSAEEEPDMYGAGALIEQFEQEIATLLGKEAAVFMPSGTMTQQIALRLWCERRNCHTVAYHPTCHLELHEQQGYQLLHGIHARLAGSPHSLLTLDELRATAGPIAALLLELPQREIGGQLPSWEDLEAQVAWARERGAALHLDGARLWEAGPYYQRPYAEIAALFDSVYVSFYKGIGALAGAALAGPGEFIAEARVWQRRHGGNLIRLFPYVLSARLQLRRRLDRFPLYHRRALAIAQELSAIPGITVKPDPPQTRMMHIYLRGDQERLLAARLEIARAERVLLFSSLRQTEAPGHYMFELAIGDAAEALTDAEIGAYFAQVMTT